ncbi:hypothetical protein HK096_007952, partial [Nowakowskiella sp. JEL0078]
MSEENWSTLFLKINEIFTSANEIPIPLIFGCDLVNIGFLPGIEDNILPSSLALASSFNKDLIFDIGFSWILSPVIDLGVDQNSPVISSTFGEDPYVIAELSNQLIKALQSSVFERPMAATMRLLLKGDLTFLETPTLMLQYYSLGIRSAISANVLTVFLDVNTENQQVANTILKFLKLNAKDFKGFTSYTTTSNLAMGITTLNDEIDVRLLSLKDELSNEYLHNINSSIRVVDLKSKLGLIPRGRTYSINGQLFASQNISESRIDDYQQTWKNLTLQAARESIILLKNPTYILPFPENLTIAVLGSASSSINNLLPSSKQNINISKINIDSIFQSMNNIALRYNGKIISQNELKLGLDLPGTEEFPVRSNVTIQVAVVCVSESMESSWIQDSVTEISLLRERYANISIVLVALMEGPQAVKQLWDLADAVVVSFRPGQFGGQAIAETIFGLNNPSARLPVSFPANAFGKLMPYWE